MTNNIKVTLDLKTEFPCDNDHVENIINEELRKEIDLYTKQILTKLGKLVEKHNKLKIFRPGNYQESA